MRLDGARAATEEKLKTEKDPKQYQVLLGIYDDVLSAKAEIESQLGSKRKKVQAVEGKAREALIESELEKALATLLKDEYGALWVLKKMHDEGSLPEFVWREIVRKTPLKHDQAGVDWESVTAAEKESKNRNDATTRRWIEIMKKWAVDSTTAWREKHGADLSLVSIQAVCNEVAEMSQHVRGVQSQGGIGQKAAWYATPGVTTSFGTLDTDSQLKPGASLMFLEWSAKEPTEPVHIVRHDKGYPLRNEDKQILSNGFVDSKGWKYSFLADGRVFRNKEEVIGTSMDPKSPPPTRTVTEWIRWTH
jgi:hypothetical protein